jgi:hypothetical protein
MKHLKAGQVLDRDPITGVLPSVLGTTKAGQVLVIQEASRALDIRFGYDTRKGSLVSYQRDDRMPTATMRTSLGLR